MAESGKLLLSSHPSGRAFLLSQIRYQSLSLILDLFLQAPEVQKMYSLNKTVAELRTKIRQEFERHRYVEQRQVVDMLLFQSNAEFQVRF